MTRATRLQLASSYMLVLLHLVCFPMQTKSELSSFSARKLSLGYHQSSFPSSPPRSFVTSFSRDGHHNSDGEEKEQHKGRTCSTLASFGSGGVDNLFSIRGGRIADSDYENEDDSEVTDDDDFDDFDEDGLFDDADFGADGDDFNEESSLSRAIEGFKQSPPFTKVYLSASFCATMMGYLSNKNEFPSYLLLEWKPVFKKLQIWRPVTAFLNFGPFGIGYLMTAHFVWTYMSTLERLNHDRPYDFWVMILFGCGSMVAGYSMLGISPRFLGHNLSTFMVYIWSRYHEGMEVNMFELFNTKAEMLPWFFLLQTYLFEGEIPLLDLLGIFFGHIYHHCKTTDILRTPRFLVDWYNGDSQYSTAIREQYKKISSDFVL